MADSGSGGHVRSGQQAAVVNEWVPVSRIHLSRRIVTEIQTIDVEVRREELVVTREAIPNGTALPQGQAPVTPDERVIILHAEVPSVSLTVLPVERVTFTPVVVADYRDLSVVLAAEHSAVEELPPTVPDPKGNVR